MPTDIPTPDRAPGIQRHRRKYAIRFALSPELAEVLADEWDRTGESPGQQAVRLLTESLGVERG